MNKTLSGVLALCSLILYTFGYSICEYFYSDDLEGWTFLRNTLKGFVYLFLAALHFIPRTSITKGCMVALCFLCFGNLADRLVFDIQSFVNSDYVLIIVALIAGVITYRIDVKRILERGNDQDNRTLGDNGSNRYGRGV